MSRRALLILVVTTGVVVIGAFVYFFVVPKVDPAVSSLSQAFVSPFGTPPLASSSPDVSSQTKTPISAPQKNSSTPSIVVSSGTKDCGEDLDCYIAAAPNCTAAKVRWSATVNIFGFNQTTTWDMYTKGLGPHGECTSHSIVENNVLSISTKERADAKAQGVSDADIDSQLQESNADAKGTIGIDTTCSFQGTANLVALLKDIKNGNFDSKYVNSNTCSAYDKQGNKVSLPDANGDTHF